MSNRTCIVTWLRVILPLGALAILSTLFLLSRHPEPEPALPYARVEAEARAQDPRITAPSWSGVTEDGATLALSADSALPENSGIGGATALRLDWRAADGLTAKLQADDAIMAEDAIRLTGAVAVTTSTGWTFAAPEVVAATDRSQLDASGGIDATAPFGHITADRLSLTRQNAHHVLNFTGGVRLVYQP